MQPPEELNYYILEIDRSTKVVFVIGCATTYLTDELGILDSSTHIIDTVMFSILAHVFFVISH